MLHLGAVIPNLSFAADAHYHHLTDDIIEGGLMRYEDGAIACPTGPGLGVKLDRDKLREYSELYQRARRLSRTIRIPAARAGRRSFRTTVGRTRKTTATDNSIDGMRSCLALSLHRYCALSRARPATTPGSRYAPLDRRRPRCRRCVDASTAIRAVLRTAQQELIAACAG